MPGFKNNPAVTVTVRPDGTYYVEKEKPQPRPKQQKQQPQAVQIRPVMPVPGSMGSLARNPSPVAVAITSSLKDLAGIAAVAKAASPALGKYGVVAAIGLGVLNAWVSTKPPPVPRFQLRRIKRTPR